MEDLSWLLSSLNRACGSGGDLENVHSSPHQRMEEEVLERWN